MVHTVVGQQYPHTLSVVDQINTSFENPPFSGTAIWFFPASGIQPGSCCNRGKFDFHTWHACAPFLPQLAEESSFGDLRAPNLKVLDDLVQNRTLKQEI